MNNRCLVLLALLGANRRFGQPPVPRTVLVKQTFLTETLRPLYHYWYRTFSFERYYHGPFTGDIFHRLEVLICNGLVQVDSSSWSRGRHFATYSITDRGAILLQAFAETEIVHLADDIVWGLQAIGVEQAGAICKLVYQEAEFARMLEAHNAQGIAAGDRIPLPAVTSSANATLEVLLVIRHLSRRISDNAPELSAREMVRSYLQILADRVRATDNPTESAA